MVVQRGMTGPAVEDGGVGVGEHDRGPGVGEGRRPAGRAPARPGWPGGRGIGAGRCGGSEPRRRGRPTATIGPRTRRSRDGAMAPLRNPCVCPHEPPGGGVTTITRLRPVLPIRSAVSQNRTLGRHAGRPDPWDDRRRGRDPERRPADGRTDGRRRAERREVKPTPAGAAAHRRPPDPHRRPARHAHSATGRSRPPPGWRRRPSCSPWPTTCPAPTTGGTARYLRRIGPWLLWRAGPARGADARYWVVPAPTTWPTQFTFDLFPDGSGAGRGPTEQPHPLPDLEGRPPRPRLTPTRSERTGRA